MLFILKHLFKLRESSPKKSAPIEGVADEESGELVKPFLEHLEDLRWVLVKTAVTLLVTTLGSLIFTRQLLHFIQAPLAAAHMATDLQNLTPADSVFVPFKLAFYAGLVFAFPLILFYLAEFVLPALTKQEKRYIMPALVIAFGLFLGGCSFCYYLILPNTLRIFQEYALSFGWDAKWSVGEYYSFVTQFVLIFGVAFELPVVVIVLVKLGFLSHSFMKTTRSYALIIIVVVAAVITPTQDFLSLACLSAPMYILYEICIWIAFFMEKSEKKNDLLPPL